MSKYDTKPAEELAARLGGHLLTEVHALRSDNLAIWAALHGLLATLAKEWATPFPEQTRQLLKETCQSLNKIRESITEASP